jgi:xylan 1,4-beta-xylosidase
VPSLPPVTALFDHPLRDVSICLAPDGFYYLTGTTGHPTWWTHNDGIRLWRSPDLRDWEPLGLVWDAHREGSWRHAVVGEQHAIWAPEIHALRGTFWLTYSAWAGDPGRTASGLLRSETGDARGPYVDVSAEPLSQGIDASLFEDADGTVYWVVQNGQVARMTEDLRALAEPPRLLSPLNHRQVGFEGAFLTRIDGRYHLLATEFVGADAAPIEHEWGMDWQEYDYSCFGATADSVYGPYGPRYLAVPHAGHNMVFRDKSGRLLSTIFGQGARAPLQERPGLVPLEIDAEGRLRPRHPGTDAPA